MFLDHPGDREETLYEDSRSHQTKQARHSAPWMLACVRFNQFRHGNESFFIISLDPINSAINSVVGLSSFGVIFVIEGIHSYM